MSQTLELTFETQKLTEDFKRINIPPLSKDESHKTKFPLFWLCSTRTGVRL